MIRELLLWMLYIVLQALPPFYFLMISHAEYFSAATPPLLFILYLFTEISRTQHFIMPEDNIIYLCCVYHNASCLQILMSQYIFYKCITLAQQPPIFAGVEFFRNFCDKFVSP